MLEFPRANVIAKPWKKDGLTQRLRFFHGPTAAGCAKMSTAIVLISARKGLDCEDGADLAMGILLANVRFGK